MTSLKPKVVVPASRPPIMPAPPAPRPQVGGTPPAPRPQVGGGGPAVSIPASRPPIMPAPPAPRPQVGGTPPAPRPQVGGGGPAVSIPARPKMKKGGEVKTLNKLFKGKDTHGEELKEGKAIKSGKLTPEQYAKGEKMEDVKKMKGGGCYAKGGVTRADGCAVKGKTKGKQV